MTEMKHTTEKWSFTMCDDGRPMVHTDGDIVCLPDPNHGVDNGLPDEFDVRNFKMIAAAPEMAEALRDWLDAEDTWDGDFADDDRIVSAKEAARAALKKAGG